MRPFWSGAAAIATAEGFLRHFAEIRLVAVDYAIAREAARIRATTGLRKPDALIVATALVIETEILVTNDRSWQSAIDTVAPDLRLHVLSG